MKWTNFYSECWSRDECEELWSLTMTNAKEFDAAFYVAGGVPRRLLGDVSQLKNTMQDTLDGLDFDEFYKFQNSEQPHLFVQRMPSKVFPHSFPVFVT